MRRLRLILDDGEPGCLPLWARRRLGTAEGLAESRTQALAQTLAALEEEQARADELEARVAAYAAAEQRALGGQAPELR